MIRQIKKQINDIEKRLQDHTLDHIKTALEGNTCIELDKKIKECKNHTDYEISNLKRENEVLKQSLGYLLFNNNKFEENELVICKKRFMRDTSVIFLRGYIDFNNKQRKMAEVFDIELQEKTNVYFVNLFKIEK